MSAGVSKKAWETFLNNDFAHLRADVQRIKGSLIVVIPLLLTILGLVGAVLIKGK